MQPAGVYDVIVVGGRIVGASTAALLAQRGFDVLLLEKTTFPSPTVSCPVVFGNSLEVLSRFGGEAVLDRLDAPRLRLYGIDYGYANFIGHLPPYKGRDYAYSLQRDRLDEALTRHVATLPGITFREGFAVRELVRQGDRVIGVRGSQNGGVPEEIRSRYAVVGADGRNSLIARLVGARPYDQKPAHAWMYYAYYHNVTPLDEPSAIGYREPGLSALVFDADQGLTVLSVGATTPSFAEVRKDPEAALLAAIKRVPALAQRIERAERATPLMGMAPTGMFRREPCGNGWALVGDAGSRLDPVTGQGIYQGLHAAELLVDALAKVRDGSLWQPAMRHFHRQRDRDTRAAYDYAALQATLAPQPWFTRRLITRMAEDPAIVRFFLGTANGATDPAENFNLLRALRIAFGPRSRRHAVQAAS